MNIVIATEKKNIRIFDECMKNANHNLLGYETALSSNFIKRIAEYYNPHILVVVRGVKSKNFDFLSSVGELLTACPKMRIIYFFARSVGERTHSILKDMRSRFFHPVLTEAVSLHLP